MATLRIDATEVVRHRDALGLLPKRLEGRLWTSLRVTTQELIGAIKAEMPVRTGRARASWGEWTPEDLVMASEAKPDDAHLVEDRGRLSIEQGSNVDYIQDLNDGTSQQAAPGFINRNVDVAQRNMKARAERIIQEVRP